MAAFTGSPVSGPNYDAQTGESEPASRVSALVAEGKLQIARFGDEDGNPYTHAAGAGTGVVKLVRLPAGKLIVFPDLSRLVTSQFAANADIHIGYAAYTKLDGTTGAADDNAFLDNGDAGGGALDTALTLPAGGMQVLESASGIDIEAMIDTANIENDDTIDGWIAYIRVS